DVGRTRPVAPEDPDRTLYRGRSAGRLALAVETFRSGNLASDDPQCHVRPRGHGFSREPAYVRRADSDATWLPAVRRFVAYRPAARVGPDADHPGTAADCRTAASNP